MKEKMTFSKQLREEIFEAQNGRCLFCEKPITDFHHRLPNSEANRKLFPLFIQSVWNIVGLCRECHINEKHQFKVAFKLAAVYEHALRKEESDA